MRCGLRFLEEHIGHKKLQLFESAYGGEWQGDIKDTLLYLLWSSAKEIAEASVDDGPSDGGDDVLSGGGYEKGKGKKEVEKGKGKKGDEKGKGKKGDEKQKGKKGDEKGLYK